MPNRKDTKDGDSTIASPGGNLGDDDPRPRPMSRAELRERADHDSDLLARGEKRLQAIEKRHARQWETNMTEWVKEERRQCETVLRLAKKIAHGQVGDWKEDLAQSMKARHGCSNYSISGIETRLTMARRGAADPNIWKQLEHECHVRGRRNLRAFLYKAEPKNLEDHQDAVSKAMEAPEPPPAHHPIVMTTIPDEELRQLRADADGGVAVLEALDLDDSDDPATAARTLVDQLEAEVERLQAENGRLRAEVARLSAHEATAAN